MRLIAALAYKTIYASRRLFRARYRYPLWINAYANNQPRLNREHRLKSLPCELCECRTLVRERQDRGTVRRRVQVTRVNASMRQAGIDVKVVVVGTLPRSGILPLRIR